MIEFLKYIQPWAVSLAFVILVIGIIVKGGKIGKWEIFPKRSLYEFWDKSLDIHAKICKITDVVQIKEQMEYVESKIYLIREKNQVVIKEMLKTKGLDGQEIDNLPLYKAFMNTVERIIDIEKGILRQTFKDIYKNDTLNDPIIENYEHIRYLHKDYYDAVIQELLKIAHKMIRENWIDNTFLTRGEMKAEIIKGHTQNVLFLEDLFVKSMLIQIKYNKRIKQLKAELQSYYTKMTGR